MSQSWFRLSIQDHFMFPKFSDFVDHIDLGSCRVRRIRKLHHEYRRIITLKKTLRTLFSYHIFFHAIKHIGKNKKKRQPVMDKKYLHYWGYALPESQPKPEMASEAKGNVWYGEQTERISMAKTKQHYNHIKDAEVGHGVFSIPLNRRRFVGGVIPLANPYNMAVAQGIMQGSIKGLSEHHQRPFGRTKDNKIWDGKKMVEVSFVEQPGHPDCLIHGWALAESTPNR